MSQAGAASPKRVEDAAAIARLFERDERVFMPGSTAEVPSLVEALCSGVAPPIAIVSTFLPGLNPSPIERLPDGTTFESIFAYPAAAGTQASGRLRHRPMSYGRYIGELARQSFDTVIVHVTPPDGDGMCSLNAAVEVTPIAMGRAKRVVAVINPRLPRIAKTVRFRLSDVAVVAEIDAPLRTYDVGAATAQTNAIADTVAGFIGDEATVQIGIGKVPDALLRRIGDRKRLRLHSGLLSDGLMALDAAGALDPGYDHVCCVHEGSAAYLAWLDGDTRFTVTGAEFTHGAKVLLGLDRFVAVNGALSVDLFGQANLEMLDGRAISAVGGAPDFSRAAALAPDGTSIIALPAISGRDAVSRIVPRLDGIVSIPRHDIDVVVTEFGAADLRGTTVMERAERLIAVAAPQHRAALTDAWRAVARRL